jgi:hypothetical protein
MPEKVTAAFEIGRGRVWMILPGLTGSVWWWDYRPVGKISCLPVAPAVAGLGRACVRLASAAAEESCAKLCMSLSDHT